MANQRKTSKSTEQADTSAWMQSWVDQAKQMADMGQAMWAKKPESNSPYDASAMMGLPKIDAASLEQTIQQLESVALWLQHNLALTQQSVQTLKMQKAGMDAVAQFGQQVQGQYEQWQELFQANRTQANANDKSASKGSTKKQAENVSNPAWSVDALQSMQQHFQEELQKFMKGQYGQQ